MMAKTKRKIAEIGTLGLLHGILHIYQSALPPIYVLLRKEFNISTLQLSLLGSVRSIINVLQGASGYLAAKIGRKRITIMGMLIYTLAVFSFGLSPSFLVLLVSYCLSFLV